MAAVMNIALLGLLILACIIVIGSFNERFHVGVAALFAAFFLGALGLGWNIEDVAALVPIKLLITLISITLLFLLAETNGSLGIVTDRILHVAQKRATLIPFTLFLATALVTALGVGNIASVALIAPTAMAIARRIKLSPLLMTVMVVGGANAAALSPLALTGVLTRELVAKMPAALVPHSDQMLGQIFILSFIAIALVHFTGFFILGGLKWLREAPRTLPLSHVSQKATRKQRAMITLLGLFAFLAVGTGIENAHVMLPWHLDQMLDQIAICALIVIVLAMLLKLAPTEKAIAKLPWSTMLLVGGMFTFIAVLEKTGALNMALQYLNHVSGHVELIALLALVTAALSAFSSSSGVVLPLFVPMVPQLLTIAGMDTVLPLLATIVVGSHLVDCSPFSSLGAMCLAASDQGDVSERQRLFRQLLLWGLAMIPVAVVVCVMLLPVMR